MRVRQRSDSVVGTGRSCEGDPGLGTCFWTTFSGTKGEGRESRVPKPALDTESNARSRRARRKHSRLVGAEAVGLIIEHQG